MAQAQRVTIDEKFNAEYSKKGLQPFVSKDGRIRNGKIERKNFANQEGANDDVYTQSSAVGAESNVVPFPQQPNRVQYQPRTQPRQPAAQAQKQKNWDRSKSKKKGARLKAKIINRAALSPLIFTYIFFQLPIAVFHIVFFGLAVIWLSFMGAITEEGTVVGFIFGIFGRIAGALNTVIETLTGVDILGFLTAINPVNIYVAITSVMLAYAIILILALGFAYIFAGVKPLSGKKLGFKICILSVCIFGYFWPIFSLFPWIFIWMYLVGKNPT